MKQSGVVGDSKPSWIFGSLFSNADAKSLAMEEVIMRRWRGSERGLVSGEDAINSKNMGKWSERGVTLIPLTDTESPRVIIRSGV